MSLVPLPTTSAAVVGFDIVATFVSEQATLGVRGNLDETTAPVLDAFIDAVMACGYASAVLDLTNLDRIGDVGLSVVTSAAHRLAAIGGLLTVRSHLATARRIMDMARFPSALRVELAGTEPANLRARPSAAPPQEPGCLPPFDLVRELTRISAHPANDDVIDRVLGLVAALAHAAVVGADGVSVSLRRHGQLATVAATDQTVTDMDVDQYATEEGPCVAASTTGQSFQTSSLAGEIRWPAFTPRAQKLGINAILSAPLCLNDRPIGALNIYSLTPAAFSLRDQELASTFATEVSSILTGVGESVFEDHGSITPAEALHARQTIAMAEGVVMEREGVTEEGAYGLLRRFSETSDRPLLERAEDVVASTRRLGSSQWLYHSIPNDGLR